MDKLLKGLHSDLCDEIYRSVILDFSGQNEKINNFIAIKKDIEKLIIDLNAIID